MYLVQLNDRKTSLEETSLLLQPISPFNSAHELSASISGLPRLDVPVGRSNQKHIGGLIIVGAHFPAISHGPFPVVPLY